MPETLLYFTLCVIIYATVLPLGLLIMWQLDKHFYTGDDDDGRE